MAKLTVRLHGQPFGVLDLQDGQEYVIGRGSECALVLSEQRGISRQHLKLFQDDGVWHAQSLSRFVALQREGQQQESIVLKKDMVFYAPPFEFRFELAAEQPAAADAAAAPGSFSRTPEGLVQPKTPPPVYQPPAQPEDHRGNLELTVAGAVMLAPYLRILYTDSDQQEVLRLEGEMWTAGRESASEIPLRDSRASRRHFELSRSREGFFVTDLGSSNGTRLNGNRLPAHEPTKVESGDLIAVLDIEIIFEIRDLALANRMQSIQPANQFAPMMPYPGYYPALPPGGDNLPAVSEHDGEMINWKDWRNWNAENVKKVDWKKVDWKKHKVKIAMGVLLPVLLIGLFTGNDKPDTARLPAGNPNDPMPFDRLSPEAKAQVKDAFSLARNLYVNGKYELCLAELAKLHEITKSGYENSKELAEFCQQGKELKSRNDDLERQQREAASLESQISMVVDGCKEKLKGKGTVDQVRACLKDAMDLNPEHAQVVEMIQAAHAHEEEEKVLAAQKAQFAERAQKSRAAFHRAQGLYKNGDLQKAIAAYDHYINGPYPDVDNLKETARRDLASIKSQIEKMMALYLEQCKTLGDKNRYKEAYLACDSALKHDPDNAAAINMKSAMLNNLRREIKSIYEDSVLEESLGNVDSAKDKWKKIIQEDLDTDEYSKKAKVLLKKYGVEM